MSAPGAPRVLVLTHSLSEVDGVGVYAAQTLRHLAPLCKHIDVFIGRKHRGVSAVVPGSGVTLSETLPTDQFPFMKLPKLLWLLMHSLGTLEAAAHRADIVHSFADYPMGFVATLVGKRTGTPVVVSGHGTYSVAPLEMRAHGKLLRWTYRNCDRFLMGADFALEQVHKQVNPNGAEVVPYGVMPGDYDEARTQGELPDVPEPYVLCVGEVKQRKGYEISLPAFLTAWKQCPELHFVIVGRFVEQDPYFQKLQSWIAEAGAQQHVHFLGNVSEGRKVALMRAARVFLLTPITSVEGGFEAFGLVFLEAGAAGTPVVGVRRSGAQDAITDGENGFLRDPEDRIGLAQALVKLAHDDALSQRMGDAGRTRAEGQTWAGAAARVREIYDELMAAESGTTPRASEGAAS